MTVTARALIFSGRPDPTWPVAKDDEAELRALVASLTRIDGPDEANPPAVLGYRGVEVVTNDGERWLATDGRVTITTASGEVTRLDAERAVERFIIATAPEGTLPPDTGR